MVYEFISKIQIKNFTPSSTYELLYPTVDLTNSSGILPVNHGGTGVQSIEELSGLINQFPNEDDLIWYVVDRWDKYTIKYKYTYTTTSESYSESKKFIVRLRERYGGYKSFSVDENTGNFILSSFTWFDRDNIAQYYYSSGTIGDFYGYSDSPPTTKIVPSPIKGYRYETDEDRDLWLAVPIEDQGRILRTYTSTPTMPSGPDIYQETVYGAKGRYPNNGVQGSYWYIKTTPSMP